MIKRILCFRCDECAPALVEWDTEDVAGTFTCSQFQGSETPNTIFFPGELKLSGNKIEFFLTEDEDEYRCQLL